MSNEESREFDPVFIGDLAENLPPVEACEGIIGDKYFGVLITPKNRNEPAPPPQLVGPCRTEKGAIDLVRLEWGDEYTYECIGEGSQY